MNTLLLDAGNTRIKWALVRHGRMSKVMAAPLTDLAPFKRWLQRAAQIDDVVGVCVAGEKIEKQLRTLLLTAGHAAPRFIHSATNAAGVRNGYREPWRLGDDRWVGTVAAWSLGGARRPVCAVSVGTALTVDLVDSHGQHRGGLIAPGPALMVRGLLGNTHGIARRAAQAPRKGGTRSRSQATAVIRPLADNTRDAIELGSLTASAALIDRCMQEVARELGARPLLFLTGGAAPAVSALVKSRHTVRDDLILKGVAVISGTHIAAKA
jgi:type III pantothenate kinase